MYERLKGLYKFKEKLATFHTPKQLSLKRFSQVEGLRQVFETLAKNNEACVDEISGHLDAERKAVLRELVRDLLSLGEEVDWGLVHDAGTTIDDDVDCLPHHISTG